MSENIANLAIDNRAGLMVIVRNAAPRREGHYPHTWMVYSVGRAIRVHVAHDHASNPYVEDRCAA
jgi:hypothetical protein